MATDPKAEFDSTFEAILDALDELAEEGDAHVALASRVLSRWSTAANEGRHVLDSDGTLELFDYLWRKTGQLLIASGDALRALSRALRPPVLQTSPGGIARDVLEASAICQWLTEQHCPPKERIIRIARVWWTDVNQAIHLSDARSQVETPEAIQASEVDKRNLEEYRNGVLALLEVGCIKPKRMSPMSDLVKEVFDSEFEYRLWSNLSHGNPFVLQEARRLHENDYGTALAALHLTSASVDAYARALVEYVRFFCPAGKPDLVVRLELLYDKLGMGDGRVRAFLGD